MIKPALRHGGDGENEEVALSNIDEVEFIGFGG